MSHYTTLDTRIVSAKHLARALRELFAKVEVHAEAQPLAGFMGNTSLGVAHVIVRKAHLPSGTQADLGFRLGSAGRFEAVIEKMDRGRFTQLWLDSLTQRYAYGVARDLLEEQGFDLAEEEQEEDGSIHLTLRRAV